MKFRENSGQDSKDFLRLKDGESATGVCVGELFELKNHWTGSKSEQCTEDNLCTYCSQGKKPSFRFRVNFIVKDENGQLVAKILESGWKVYEALRDLNCDYDVEKHAVKISRRGSTMNDTVYSILPAKGGALSPEKIAQMAKVPLHDLSLKDQVPTQVANEPKFDEDENLPF